MYGHYSVVYKEMVKTLDYFFNICTIASGNTKGEHL